MESIAQLQLADLPAIGASLAGGIFAGLTTAKDGKHFAVALLEEKPSEQLAWKSAMDWAESIGAALPTRPVAALLFANVKAQFDEDWHWTSEESSASYAWGCYFLNGFQDDNHESYEGCARAVRLIPVAA